MRESIREKKINGANEGIAPANGVDREEGIQLPWPAKTSDDTREKKDLVFSKRLTVSSVAAGYDVRDRGRFNWASRAGLDAWAAKRTCRGGN